MPHAEDWDEACHIPIELWPKAAAVGLLGIGYPEEFGGVKEGIDCWHQWITSEESFQPRSGNKRREKIAPGTLS